MESLVLAGGGFYGPGVLPFTADALKELKAN